jgi:hypothetical protein
MNASTINPEIKLLEYQDQLAFVQSELIEDRSKLARAKKQLADPEEIQAIETDITNLELAVDKIQAQILILKHQIPEK